jgi:hypothetical protein
MKGDEMNVSFWNIPSLHGRALGSYTHTHVHPACAWWHWAWMVARSPMVEIGESMVLEGKHEVFWLKNKVRAQSKTWSLELGALDGTVLPYG